MQPLWPPCLGFPRHMEGSKATWLRGGGVSWTLSEPRAWVSLSSLVTVTEVLLRSLFFALVEVGVCIEGLFASFQRTMLRTHVHEENTVFPFLSLQRE